MRALVSIVSIFTARKETLMCQHLERAEATLDRRALILGGATALAGLALSRTLGWPEKASAVPTTSAGAGHASGPVLETVTGPLPGSKVDWAVAHEHFFVDFLGPTDPGYMDVNWSDVTGACVNSARDLRAQGVDLFIDWTNLGVGRNVLLLRDITRRTGMNIVCATGIYKNLYPPEFATASIADMANHFYRELTQGIDGTPIRAGWIKIASTMEGPTRAEERVHRAAARAGKRAGSTISLHGPSTAAAQAVVKTLEGEGFDIRRFIWGHAQPASVGDHQSMAARGAMIQYDAISGHGPDPFFHGPTDDESMLDRIGTMVEAGYGDRVVLATDASVFVNPAKFQYDRDNAYTYGVFLPKLQERIGKEATRAVLRDNVLKAFRRGSNVRPLRTQANTSLL
jgi:phosphotriesterase-related protein